MTRLNLNNRIYFLTSVTYERKNLFQDPELAQIVEDQWKHYEETYDFKLHAYAILPDHYHAIIELSGDKDISQVLYAVNSYSAKLINEGINQDKARKIWQGEAFDEVIKSEDMYHEKLAYILLNPWREGLVDDPFGDYSYGNLSDIKKREGREFLEDLFSRYSRWSE